MQTILYHPTLKLGQTVIMAASLLLALPNAPAVEATASAVKVDPYADETPVQRDARTQWWREARQAVGCLLPHPGPLPLGWEREDSHPCCGMVGPSGFTRRWPSILPLPAGEGRGEGEVIVLWLAFEHCPFKVPMHIVA